MGKWSNKKGSTEKTPAPFKSRFEFNVSQSLESVPAQFTYEPHKLEYTLTKTYTPDFVITRPDGTDLYVESKGYFDHVSREKMVAVKEQHPELSIVLLFMADKLINKKSGFRYSDWAAKHGFDFSVGSIPFRWIYGSALPKKLENKEILINGNHSSL